MSFRKPKPAQPPDSRAGRGAIQRFIGAVTRAHSVTAALVALVAGCLAIYTEWPDESKRAIPEPTERLIIRATVKPGMTFADFVAENCLDPRKCGTYSPRMERMRVISVTARISQIVGYKGRKLLASWVVDEALSGAAAGEPQRRSFQTTLNSDEQDLQPQWLPLPKYTGRFVVEVTVFDPATGHKVTATCTPVFRVARNRAGAPLEGTGGQGKPHSCA